MLSLSDYWPLYRWDHCFSNRHWPSDLPMCVIGLVASNLETTIIVILISIERVNNNIHHINCSQLLAVSRSAFNVLMEQNYCRREIVARTITIFILMTNYNLRNAITDKYAISTVCVCVSSSSLITKDSFY